jgi:spore coat protein CotH
MNQLRIPTNVVNEWPYYEFEEYIKLLNKKNEEEKRQNENDEKNQKAQMPNFGNITKGFTPPNFKMPDLGGFSR